MAAEIDSEFEGMLDDVHDTFGETCEVRLITPGAFNTTTGIRASTTATVSLSAVRSPERIQPGSGGSPDVRFVDFRVKASDLQADGIKGGDQIVDADSQLWHIFAVDLEVNGLQVVVRCRNVQKVPLPNS